MVRCRSGGCKRTPKREARGRQGFQRCPSVLASGRPEGARGSSGVPQSWQAGGQRAPGVPAVSLSPGKRESRGRQGFQRCPSVLASGSPEGWGCPPPFLAGVWGCPPGVWGYPRSSYQYSPSHPAFPLLHHCERSEAIRGAGKRESRGRSPLAGWGCPRVHISTSLPIPPSPYSRHCERSEAIRGLGSGSPEGAALWQGCTTGHMGVSLTSFPMMSGPNRIEGPLVLPRPTGSPMSDSLKYTTPPFPSVRCCGPCAASAPYSGELTREGWGRSAGYSLEAFARVSRGPLMVVASLKRSKARRCRLRLACGGVAVSLSAGDRSALGALPSLFGERLPSPTLANGFRI